MDLDQNLAAEVTRHAADSVARAEYSEDPFPHFTTFDFFPAAFYDDLVAGMPSNDEYLAIAGKTSVTGDDRCRLRFDLKPEMIDTIGPGAQRLWSAARAALTSPEVRAATYDKLAEGLAFRFGCDPNCVVDEAPGQAVPALYRETKGYRITPHPDTRKKVVTMQVSLAADESQENLGTELYRRRLNPSAWKEEPRGFETVKTVPFRPNAASAFVVLNSVRLKSWHGRTLLEGEQGVRNSILNIWYRDAEPARLGEPTAAAA